MYLVFKKDFRKFEKSLRNAMFFDEYSELFNSTNLHIISDSCFLTFDYQKGQKVLLCLQEYPQKSILEKYFNLPKIYFGIYHRTFADFNCYVYSSEFLERYMNRFDYFLSQRDLPTDLSISPFLMNYIYHSGDSRFTKKVFKYYKEKSIDSRPIDKGQISFCCPTEFNDPFDSDLNVVSGYKKYRLTNLFRVLSLAQSNDNILMWSYYADDHRGYCYEYDLGLILDGLSKIYHGICFLGEVNYSDKRPQPRISSKNLIKEESMISFLLDHCFTKFEDWSHEKEYRLLIFSRNYIIGEKNESKSNPNLDPFFNLQTTIINKFAGCKNTNYKYSNNKMKIDPKFYKLVI